MKYTKIDILNEMQYAGRAYAIPVFSKMFDRYVVVTIGSCTGIRDKDITNEIVECLNMFVKTNRSLIKEIKTEIYENYKSVISNCSYGFISDELLAKHNGDDAKANQEYFGYKNNSSAFQSCSLGQIYIADGEHEEHPLYYSIKFETPWDNEHGIYFSIRDNNIIHVE